MGTKLAKAAVVVAFWTFAGYATYRIQGGPPILKVVKAVRQIKNGKREPKEGIELRESEFMVD